jgi:hypothetical protein
MIADKHGKELKIGDEVFIRGKIMAMPMDLEDEGKGILQVTWESGAPLLDYVESKVVEKRE